MAGNRIAKICRLCRTNPPISSHVLPALGYRRFVADQSRGGACLKLATLVDNPEQLQLEWFCKGCEQLFGEAYAGTFLDQVIANRNNCRFDDRLLRFLVSLSLRAC